MKIRVIQPVTSPELALSAEQDFRSVAPPGTQISVCVVERGAESIESQYDIAVALPDILIQVDRANHEHMDAVIINCMMDPGLDASREISSIPVIGMGEASYHLAFMLAHKFSVLTILDRDIPDFERTLRKYGLLAKVASIRSINVPVLDLLGHQDEVAQALTEAALRAVREDGAGAIAFGCSGLTGAVAQVDQALKAAGLNIPALNPTSVALNLAESLVHMGLVFSKITYPAPLPKKIIFP